MPLSAEFTQQSDVVRCGRDGCQKFTPRFQLQEITSDANPNISRFVCLDCFKYYQRKTAAVRNAQLGGSFTTEQTREIRQGTNLAQRNYEAAPPVRTVGAAFPNLPIQGYSIVQGQPTMQGSSTIQGPSIAIQGAVKPLQYSGHVPSQPIGYNAVHNQLSQQFIGHEARSLSVYRAVPRHSFILWVQLAYWNDSKGPGKIVPNSAVIETCDEVDIHIGFAELKQLAITIIAPCLKTWLKGFILDPETLELRDKDYVAIKQHPRDALIQYFIAKSSNKGVIKYKPKGRFVLYMFISRGTFLAIEDHWEQVEEHQEIVSSSTATHQVLELSGPSKIDTRKQKGKGKGKKAIRSDEGDSDNSLESINFPEASDLIQEKALSSTAKPDQNLSTTVTSRLQQLSPFKSGTKRKTVEVDGLDETQQTPQQPTAKATQPLSPDLSLLDIALKRQAEPTEAVIKATLPVGNLYFADIYVIPKRSLQELLANPDLTSINLNEGGIMGTLDVNFKKTIGEMPGTFKTAHLGFLRPSIDSNIRNEFPWQMKLAIKRPFYTNSNILNDTNQASGSRKGRRAKSQQPQRYVLGSEVHELAQEIRCLIWSDALMGFVYEFINQQIEARGTPSFPIPSFRFVRCALVVSRSPETHATLAEEYIDGKYLKYIDNRLPIPFDDITDPDELHRANFLAFAQHVQWKKIGQKAFVTDFQGNETLLTDPQVLTHPDLGGNLFSQGNLPGSFLNFPKKHICNCFCEFFELGEPENCRAPNFGPPIDIDGEEGPELTEGEDV